MKQPDDLDPAVLASLVDYNTGTVAILRTEDSISEWVISSHHYPLSLCR